MNKLKINEHQILSFCTAFVFVLIMGCELDTKPQKNKFDPLKYVDPFICTEGDSHVGYYYEDKLIEGFSHLRIGGAGSRGKGGGILVKPGIGNFTTKIDEFRERYDKQSEEASPGNYTLILESGVKLILKNYEQNAKIEKDIP